MKFNIKTEFCFPVHFIAVGIGLIFIGVLIINSHPWIAPIAILGGLILSTSHYRLSVDLIQKKYMVFTWIMGIRFGSWKRFDQAHYFYLTSGKYSQRYGTYDPQSYTEGKLIMAYLKLDDEIKLPLFESKFERNIVKKITKMSNKFKLPIKDLR